MTRTQRITKLANAIKEYRGSYVPGSEPKKWIRHPKTSAKTRIEKWLKELHVTDIEAAMVAIDNFYDVNAMRTWLEGLEAPPTFNRPGTTDSSGASSDQRQPLSDKPCPPSL